MMIIPRASVLLLVVPLNTVIGQPFLTLDATPQRQHDEEEIGAFGNPTDATTEVKLSDQEKATFDVLANAADSSTAEISPPKESISSSRSRSTTAPAPSTGEPTAAPTRKPSTSPPLSLIEQEAESFLVDAAYISENYPDRNYDAQESGFALISTEPRLDALLRFELPVDITSSSSNANHITGATLEVDTVYGVDPVGAWIYQGISDDWSTSSISWDSSKIGFEQSQLIGTMEATEVEGRSKALLDNMASVDGKYITLRIVAGRDDDYSALGLDAKLSITFLSDQDGENDKSEAIVTDEELLAVIEMELDEIDEDEEEESGDDDTKQCNTKEEKRCRDECFEEKKCDSDEPRSNCHSRCRDDCCSSDDEGVVFEDGIETDNNETSSSSSSSLDYKRNQRTFPIQDDSLPCEEYNRHNPEGVYYIKIPKTDTYYWSTVAYRSAMKRDKKCFVHAEHADAYELNLRNRNIRKSFAFTFIRNPKDYVLKTYFYFKVTKNGEKPTATSIQEYSRDYGNKQSDFMMCEANKRVYEKRGIRGADDLAKAIASEYDFIGLVEKQDESLVLMQLLLGLDTEDILYNPSPNAGTISLWKDDSDVCERVKEEYIPKGAKGYFESEDFYDDNDVDIKLYREVENTMEATIDRIGRDTFTTALRKYRKQMEVVERKCLPSVEYKCSGPGKPWKDLNSCGKDGCDAKCISSLQF